MLFLCRGLADQSYSDDHRPEINQVTIKFTHISTLDTHLPQCRDPWTDLRLKRDGLSCWPCWLFPFFFLTFEIFWTNTKVTRVTRHTRPLDLFALHICLICGLSFSLLEHLRISCRCQDPSPLSIWAWLSWEQGHSPHRSEAHLLYRLSCSSTWRQGARIREGEFQHGSQQHKITLSQDMKGGLRERTEGKKDDSMISGRKGPSHKKKPNVEAGCCFKLSNSIPTPTPENTVQECHSMV